MATKKRAPQQPSPSSVTPASGFHRIHMVGDQDWLTVYLPLDDEHRLLRMGTTPWLLKALIDGTEWFGELHSGDGSANRITWESDWPDTDTDLGTVPLRLRAPVVLQDEDGSRWTFTIRSLIRV